MNDPLGGDGSIEQGTISASSSENLPPLNLSPAKQSYGDLLEIIRKRRNLSQGALAKLMGRSTSYISLLESDLRRPTDDTFTLLADALAKTPTPLTPDERERLGQAADIPDAISQLIRHAAAALSARNGADELQQALIHEDLPRIITSYANLLQGYQRLNDGRFQEARDTFEPLAFGEAAEALPPALRASAGITLADVALKQGDPGKAQMAIDKTLRVLRERLPQQARPFHAEANAVNGLIALREGRYADAKAAMTSALTIYKECDSTAIKGSPDAAAAAVGLTKSYNRLALLCLLMNDPEPARSYAASALRELEQVSPVNDLSDTRRLRLIALQAWACAEVGDYTEARRLRQVALNAYTQLQDEYGIAKAYLYMADDARLQIEATVEPQNAPQIRFDQRRVEQFAKLVGRRDVRLLINQALEYYREAIIRLDKLGEGQLMSRAHRGCGDMLRYRALLDPEHAKEIFGQAKRSLQRALESANRARQDRLRPGILESLARLAWDQGLLAEARDNYFLVIDRLRAEISRPGLDEAARRQFDRCVSALEIVKQEISGPNSANAARNALQAAQPDPSASLAVASAEWQDLCRQLARAVVTAIQSNDNHVAPVSLNALSFEWTQALYRLDMLQIGPRTVAQGNLSSSFEPSPLDGMGQDDSEEIRRLHSSRYTVCETRMEDAQSHPADAYTDICARQEIEESLRANDILARHTRLRITTASNRLRRFDRGYRLYVVNQTIPIHFYFKGQTVLIELTDRARDLAPGIRDLCPAPGSEACYQFEDPILFSDIQRISDEMRRIAERAGMSGQNAIDWLDSLLADVPATESYVSETVSAR